MQSLKERLEEVMASAGWERADLVRISGQSSSVVSQWLGKGGKEIKTIGKLEAAEAIGRASGFAPLWVAKGMLPKKRFDSPSFVAHALSYTPFNLPVVTREQLVGGKEVEGKFILRLTDNALASYAASGKDVIFDADLEPEPGDGVLIRDAAGQVHVRRLAPTKQPGRWQGVSDDPVIYPTLDSVDDGLTVLAVWFTVFEQRLSRA